VSADVRVYLPATLPLLRGFLDERQVGPVGAPVFAVTPMLREMHLGDSEELEYLAQVHAARACLRLLREDPQAPSRRVVLALEAPPDALTEADHAQPGSVRLAAELDWAHVAAGLVDGLDVAQVVRAAVDALADADAGDDDPRFLLDEVESHELGWWAVQELPDLF
jgi:hypothetical protein